MLSIIRAVRPAGRAPSRRRRWARGAPALVALAASVVAPGAAVAFDSGPHNDMSRDALTAEGFGAEAQDAIQVNNWYVDLYENEEKTPHSGHASWFKTLLGGGYGDREHWSRAVIDAADRTHFDGTGGGFSSGFALSNEWERLKKATAAVLRDAARDNDPAAAFTALGASLHQVQDFYTHSNWVEPRRAGFDGPDWRAEGLGATPTWFDVPHAARLNANVYVGGSRGIRRSHGGWRSSENRDLRDHTNKDWSARPLYLEAYTAAYFGSRQWLKAARAWTGDDAFWRAIQRYRDTTNGPGRSTPLTHEVRGAFRISLESGHWNGQGEPIGSGDSGPSGSLTGLRDAIGDYFEPAYQPYRRTHYRRTFERVITRVAADRPPEPPAPLVDVPGSAELQRDTRFARVRVTRVKGRGAGDAGPDRADFYARSYVAGQSFTSPYIHGRDGFSFGRPNGPFTFLKALPSGTRYYEPLTDLRVVVTTADVGGAGTDDDVYLRLSDTRRYQLDRARYDDFERGDDTTYSLPVDSLGAGPLLRDIAYLQVEKSPDGRNGAWRVERVRVIANGRVIVDHRAARWLRGTGRSMRLIGYERPTAPGDRVPVRLALYDIDGFVAGSDDHADIHPDHDRRNLAFAWQPVRPLIGTSAGGDRYAGRLDRDGDRAELSYQLDLVTPVVPAPSAAAPPARAVTTPAVGAAEPGSVAVTPEAPAPATPDAPAGGRPDLIVTAVGAAQATIANAGAGGSGTTSAAVTGRGATLVPPLGPGQQVTVSYACRSGATTVTVDPGDVIEEGDETNNQRTATTVC